MPAVDTETGAPPRFLIAIAAALAIGLAVAVAVFGLSSPGEETPPPAPLPLVPVSAPQATSGQCAALVAALPGELTSAGRPLARRDLADPAPPATAGWGDGDPLVLRCGLDRPPELTRTAMLRMINDVQWIQVPGAGSSTWFVVDREVYVALTVPENTGTGPLQRISEIVADTLAPAPLRFD